MLYVDSHFRIGGAIGSGLQAADCPKESGTVNKRCIAAALVLRLTQSSSAYLENVWVWTADHDLDRTSQDQLDIYAARGILIESQGPTWLYGTSSEHHALYQYQFYNAKNVVMGMIQTESPYYQPVPRAPQPFKVGQFPADPDFTNCTSTSLTCSVSWAVRIIDSSSIYLLGAGMFHNPYHLSLILTLPQGSIAGSRTTRKIVLIMIIVKIGPLRLKRVTMFGSTTWSQKPFAKWLALVVRCQHMRPTTKTASCPLYSLGSEAQKK